MTNAGFPCHGTLILLYYCNASLKNLFFSLAPCSFPLSGMKGPLVQKEVNRHAQI